MAGHDFVINVTSGSEVEGLRVSELLRDKLFGQGPDSVMAHRIIESVVVQMAQGVMYTDHVTFVEAMQYVRDTTEPIS